ncbi:ribosomal RNA small subunit methyltransferase E [Betaproteobacteria bacterium]|nr:ribosomal RNA small subunit methyltransferase E [Betaproteobacteria bacterium]GHU42519.1 ribosomal RNA small subunit methyltransferase E [Betaproteobacteria bacterium]
MSHPRFFCALPLADGIAIDLPDSVARHAAQVLRMPQGSEMILFDGEGGEYPARLDIVGKAKARAQLGHRRDIERESPLSITLAQAMQTADKMDFTLQKAVELGVAAFQPLASRRSVTRLTGERLQKRESHWQGVAVAACEQCGRNRLPTLLPYANLADWLAGQEGSAGLKLMLAPEGATTFAALAAAGKPGCEKKITLLIGAEGGLDATEIAAATRAGFISLRLGARILRTETAGVAALAVIQNLWGDF